MTEIVRPYRVRLNPLLTRGQYRLTFLAAPGELGGPGMLAAGVDIGVPFAGETHRVHVFKLDVMARPGELDTAVCVCTLLDGPVPSGVLADAVAYLWSEGYAAARLLRVEEPVPEGSGPTRWLSIAASAIAVYKFLS